MLTEKAHTGEFIMSMDEGHVNFDNVTLISGQNLYPGAVLGKITASGKYTAVNEAAGDGSQNAAGILYGRGDASGGDIIVAAITRGPIEVNGESLDYGTQSASQEAAANVELIALGIVVR